MAITVQEAEVEFSAVGLSRVQTASMTAGKAMDRLAGAAKRAAGAAARIGRSGLNIGVPVIAAAGGAMLKLAADAETLNTQFKVLIGSQEGAAKLMDEIDRFAASTPFQKMDIADAARQLLAFGGSADTAVDELKMLGDLAAGTGQPIGELAELYGKAKVQGRLFGEDINQLTGRGIPIIQALAKEFGVAESEVKGLVTEGKVGFPEMQRALAGMTGPGGKFAGLMAELSGTTAGKFSTFVDNMKLFGQQMGEVLLPHASALLDSMMANAGAVDGFAGAFGRAIEATTTWWTETSNQLQDVGVVLGVLAADIDLAFIGLFKDLDNHINAWFDQILENSKRLISNLIELAKNAPGILENTGRNIGERAAFALGLSDEIRKIDPLEGVRLQSFQDFKTPELPAETKQVMSDIAEQLRISRQQRAQPVVPSPAAQAAEGDGEGGTQAFVTQDKTGQATPPPPPPPPPGQDKEKTRELQRGNAQSVFNRIQESLANKSLKVIEEQLKTQLKIFEAQERAAVAIENLPNTIFPVLG